ncbi:MAG: hypothetical protein ACI9OJ_001761, partial [Myxococcota bacterium]
MNHLYWNCTHSFKAPVPRRALNCGSWYGALVRSLTLISVFCLLLSCGSDSDSDSSDSGPADIADELFTVQIEPSAPTSRDDLRPVSPSDGVSFRWTRDASERPEIVEVSSSETIRGEVWAVTATRQTDGRQAEASVTIRNSAPRCAAATLSPADPLSTSTLTCFCGQRDEPDPSDPIGDSCEILVDDRAFASCTVGAAELRRGDIASCTLTPFDGIDAGPLALSSSITIGNGIPHGGAVTIAPLQATENDVLTCLAEGAADPDSDLVTWSYEWFVNDSPVASSTAIDGGGFDKNDVVYCVATASDGIEAGTPLQSESVTIGNSVPSLAVVAINPASGTRLTTFDCVASGLLDVDPSDEPTTTIEWFVDGQWVASDVTFQAGGIAVGAALSCRATPTDGESSGQPSDSLAVTIYNLPPTLESVAVTPPTADHASTLVCAASASDPELDPVTVSWRWRINGSLLTAQFENTLSGVFSAGDSIACEALCSDPYATTPWEASAPVVIKNLPPIVGELAVHPSTAGPCGTLTCAGATPVDPEGKLSQVETVWLVDDFEPVVAVALNAPSPGSVVRCQVTATDSNGSSTSATSAAFTVTNVAPTISAAVVQPSAPTVGDLLTCQAAGYSDPDCGVAASYTAIWTFDPPADPVTSATLDTASLAPGTVATCSLSASDGFDESPSQFDAVTLAAAPVEAPTVTISAPSGPSGPISCVPDSPAEGASITWQAGATPPFVGPATLDPSPASDCDIVTCQFTLPGGAQSNLAQLIFGFGPDCDDGNSCTQSGCHPSGGCESLPTSAACDDGEICTLGDTCDGGECSGTANACDDGNPCTEAVCAPGVGCSSGFKPGPCSDGNTCTSDDACSDGACAPGPTLPCDDSDPC